jgi:hypothetical protein
LAYSGSGKERWVKIRAEQAKNQVENTADNITSQATEKAKDAVDQIKKKVS